MDNNEIIQKKLADGTSASRETGESEEHYSKYVIFLLNSRKYAMSASFIREITISEEIFFLPFVPRFLSGLLNRHGNPHVVVDLGIFLNEKETKGSTFMIMENDNDQIAFVATEVESISNIGESLFHPLTGDGGTQNFFFRFGQYERSRYSGS